MTTLFRSRSSLIVGALLQGALLSLLPAQRVTTNLQALYDFEPVLGNTVRDRSGARPPLDLQILGPKKTRAAKGQLEIVESVIIRSKQPASRLANAIRQTNALTVEAWIKPENTRQSGPARIVTLSKGSSERNFTLGQDGDKFDARLRSTQTSTNGIPSTATKSRTAAPKPTHVIYTRDREGLARIYVNGEVVAERTVGGDLANWNPTYHLAIGNELSGDRPWQGTYYLVAIYNRALSGAEVSRNFKAGVGAETGAVVRSEPDPKELHFETKVAPLLANHCVECHDPATRKGKLNLTQKATTFAALKDGIPVVPGDPAKSILWEAVYHDDMPEDGEPLSEQQKSDLKKWIEDGAVWTLDRIDPANYLHSSGSKGGRWVQRLTVDEYIATVKATVAVDIEAEARALLPRDLRADGFANTAYNLNVDLKHVDAYSKLAEIIVSRMDPVKFASRFAKNRRFTDKDMEAVIRPMGTWILRGPLTNRELITYRGISTSVASVSGTFEEAVALIIQAMLQSPRFIYRIENERGDGTLWPADDYELASRLSYMIWGASPDEELMRAARDGKLTDPATMEAQAKRMLADPRAVDRSLRFVSQWLNLGRLDNMQPNPERFPHWDQELAADMRKETLAFFEEVVWKQKRPLSDLLNAQFTYLTPRLAQHYAGEHQRGSARGEQELERRNLESDPTRGGLLTHGSVLTMGGDDASMVTRGLFVMRNLLRGVVKDPPPGVDTTPIPPRPGLSHRGAAEQRIEDRSCGGCHSKFEPLAFGLEKYNGLGTFHETDEHGNNLREDGNILFPGESEAVSYQTAAQLMDLLAQSDRVRESLTHKVIQFSLGRPLTARDAPLVQEIHQTAQENGGTWPDILVALVTSDLVRLTPTVAAN